MNVSLFRTLLTALCLVIHAQAATTPWYELNETYTFETYMREFRKSYATPEETIMRRVIFEDNLRQILHHNRRIDVTWKNGVNHLTDRTPEEMKALRGYRRVDRSHHTPMVHQKGTSTFPNETDWRLRGAVSAVKDQGQCGSCWAFASASTIESFWFLKTSKKSWGKLMDLSPQQIASCTPLSKACIAAQGTGVVKGRAKGQGVVKGQAMSLPSMA